MPDDKPTEYFTDLHARNISLQRSLADLESRYLALFSVCAFAQSEADRLRAGLKWYADGCHMLLTDRAAWDTVTGEPQNLWCDEAGTATIEDGSIAKWILDGKPIDLNAQGELNLEVPLHHG